MKISWKRVLWKIKKTCKIRYCEEKDKMSLTDEQNESHNNQIICYLCKEEFDSNDKKLLQSLWSLPLHYTTLQYPGAAHSIFNLRYKTPKEIPVIIRNGSNYDYL